MKYISNLLLGLGNHFFCRKKLIYSQMQSQTIKHICDFSYASNGLEELVIACILETASCNAVSFDWHF